MDISFSTKPKSDIRFEYNNQARAEVDVSIYDLCDLIHQVRDYMWVFDRREIDELIEEMKSFMSDE